MDAEKIIVYIATGRSRYERQWHNLETTWERLAAKLAKTHRTAESVREYAAAPKERQAEIKDVGGFVGGYLAGGSRKRGSVLSRSVVTLDADFAPGAEEFAAAVARALPGTAWAIYSTHKHTPEAARLRVVAPLDREVAPDEYEAIARRVAGEVGIEWFDDTTYDAARLMYWPSTPKDGEFFARQAEGAPLSADAVLARYKDWRDVSAWPRSARQGEAVRHEMRKAGDPLAKHGVVGAFCRAYTLTEAMDTFLPGVYEPTAHPDRYTYAEGSTAGGMIVYEDKWAYSHHATDPACGQLCNAFDLVRVHLYGAQDAACRETTDITHRPSYKAMEALAIGDGRVREVIAEERLAAAREAFAGVELEESAPEDKEWKKKLATNKRGEALATIPNVALILDNDPLLAGRVERDLFAHRDAVVGRLPWRDAGGYWDNTDDANLRGYLERFYALNGQQKIYDGYEVAMTKRGRHPVRDFLDNLPPWDGVPRLDTLLHDYLGAPNTPYVWAVTRKAFTACVARIKDPGCKFDNVLILQGGEGIGKSTLLHVMGGEWFSDCVGTIGGKEGMEALQGVWLVELGELMAIKRSEVEAVKAFITRQEDSFRPAYGRKKESYPRQCVFFGTTNEEAPLKGDTGNRRFWVVRCAGGAQKSPWEDLPKEREQIWAEALARWEEGEPLYLDAAMERAAREIQKGANEMADDPRAGQIEAYLDTPLPADWYGRTAAERAEWFRRLRRGELDFMGVGACTLRRDMVSTAEILVECFGERLDERAKYKTREYKALMRYVEGWEILDTYKTISSYGRQRSVFVRITKDC